MPGRRSGKATREEGLERTDNNLEFTSWPQVNMINQKNYYTSVASAVAGAKYSETDFLKRDDQALALRLQNEENRNRMARAHRDKDRALAQSAQSGVPLPDVDLDMEDNTMAEENPGESETSGAKVVVIHPGSQNLRIGLASDALPKTVPMVIARKAHQAECEEFGGEPWPKRRKIDTDTVQVSERLFGDDFAKQFAEICVDLKTRMRKKNRRFVPNSREVVINYNRRTPPDIIPELNDINRVDWTEIPSDTNEAPDYIVGQAALRLPDYSKPRYKLSWPLRYGCFNERDYLSKDELFRDFGVILEEAMKNQLGLHRRKDWAQYSCVFIVPDLYERNYVTIVLDMLLRDFGFRRVCFVQESVSASYGAGYSACVIVDIGAQKTSICCVDEGMCIEQSRINLKYGGSDVTEMFVKMMLVDHFPYAELNLRRRHDFLLAEELKQRFCTFAAQDIQVNNYECHLRAFGQNTRHYLFKTYDEVMAAPMGYYKPSIFENAVKLDGRRKLIDRSYDLYDGSPNDPLSSAQAQVLAMVPQSNGHMNGTTETQSQPQDASSPTPTPTPNHQQPSQMVETPSRHNVAESPAAKSVGTPQPGRQGSPAIGEKEPLSTQVHPVMEMIRTAEVRDRTLPTMSLDQAVILSIEHGARGDERKMRDFYGGILPIGGGTQTYQFRQVLEEELKEAQPRFAKDLTVGVPPREIDPQVLVWKGASVFGKLRGTNDVWIGGVEYDRLGNRLLAYKCLWNW